MVKQKRIYSEAQLAVVQLSGKSALLSGSTTVSGSTQAHGLFMGNYTSGGSVFE